MPDLTIENRRYCLTREGWEREVQGSGGKRYTVGFGRVREGHDFACNCPAFTYGKGKHCKHIEMAKRYFCGWIDGEADGLKVGALSGAESLAARAEDRCPSCGGGTGVMRVGV